MRTRKVFAAIGICLVAPTACTGSGGSGAAKTATPKATQPQIVQSTPAAPNTPAGIVLTACNSGADGIRNVKFIDPNNGNETETRYFVIQPMEYASLGDCNSNQAGAKLRSAFNGDFTSIAAQKAQDTGNRAGLIRFTKSMQTMHTDFTDLSGVKDDGGFGSPIQQSMGAFGPDGKLYFVQGGTGNGKLMAVDPANGAPQSVPSTDDIKNVDPTNRSFPVNFGVYFVAGDPRPQFDLTTQEAAAPDGSWAFWTNAADSYLSFGKPGTSGSHTEPNYEHPAPTPVVYLSKTSYLGLASESNLVLANVNGKSVTSRPLLPETDGKIIDPTVSPDGTRIAFVLQRPTTCALYTAPIGGGQPTKIMDLDRTLLGVAILGWK